jgi:GntP family gluconate:H+ symporter
MVGKLLADSGGSDTIVDTIIGKVGARGLPWAMALIAAILGLPLFFEVGVVLLVPVVLLVARRLDIPVMRVGIPALAGLSILHGLVPPHPGPLVAIDAVGADLGRTLLFGLIVAVPTLVICGPLLARAIVELVVDDPESGVQRVFDFIGTPTVALLAAVLVAMFALGFGTGMDRGQVEKSLGSGLPTIAGILLIVAAGGGFKQMLVDSGVADVIGNWAADSGLSILVLGWLVAVGVRLATGSATVATITAGGIVSGIAADLGTNDLSLLVLAIGCGSLFFSHVNDAGFWLVKEYLGLTIGQTIKSWSVMETAISVVGLVCVLLLNLVV